MAPRSVDHIVQEALGAQMLTICRLQAEIEAAHARIAELTPTEPAPDPPKD